MKIETSAGGIKLEHPIMNGAGSCRTIEQVSKVARSASSAVVHGSTTLLARLGNEGEVFAVLGGATINSVGMGNTGCADYLAHGRKLVLLSHEHGKPFIMSVAGIELSDWAPLTAMAMEIGADGVELNWGCPNVMRGDEQGFVFELVPSFALEQAQAKILTKVTDVVYNKLTPGRRFQVSVKLSPYSDREQLKRTAYNIARFKDIVRAVTTCNTFPSGYALGADGKPRITPAKGMGGLGGQALKHIALGQVLQLREALPAEIDIIGVGGVATGQDVFDLMRAGASAVQITSAYLVRNEDPKIFGEILAQYLELLS